MSSDDYHSQPPLSSPDAPSGGYNDGYLAGQRDARAAMTGRRGRRRAWRYFMIIRLGLLVIVVVLLATRFMGR